jgi:HK97 family phage prohead protease
LREHPRNAQLKLEIRGAEEASRIIKGIANSGEPDRYGDICDVSGASWKLPLPLLDAHDHSRVLGVVQTLRRTDKGLEFSARVAKVDSPPSLRERIDAVWTLIRHKLLTTVSIGFRPTKVRPRERGKGNIYEEFEVLELSVVAVPADASARIQEVAEAAAYRVLSPAEEMVERALAEARAQRGAGIVRRTGRVVKL